MSATVEESTRIASLLHALSETLESERAALIENDAALIHDCAESKKQHLRRLNEFPRRDGDVFAGFTADLRAIAELNLANGGLIARRRQETIWTLRQIGLYDQDGGYDSHGSQGSAVTTRHRVTV